MFAQAVSLPERESHDGAKVGQYDIPRYWTGKFINSLIFNQLLKIRTWHYICSSSVEQLYCRGVYMWAGFENFMMNEIFRPEWFLFGTGFLFTLAGALVLWVPQILIVLIAAGLFSAGLFFFALAIRVYKIQRELKKIDINFMN